MSLARSSTESQSGKNANSQSQSNTNFKLETCKKKEGEDILNFRLCQALGIMENSKEKHIAKILAHHQRLQRRTNQNLEFD